MIKNMIKKYDLIKYDFKKYLENSDDFLQSRRFLGLLRSHTFLNRRYL